MEVLLDLSEFVVTIFRKRKKKKKKKKDKKDKKKSRSKRRRSDEAIEQPVTNEEEKEAVRIQLPADAQIRFIIRLSSLPTLVLTRIVPFKHRLTPSTSKR